MTRVSAIIPAYNALPYLCSTIESLVAQSHSDLEIIVVDDGSTDGTAAWVAKHYPQIILRTQTNAGVAAARNTGIQVATGEYIAPIDADDRWLPSAAEKLACCLDESDSQVGVVYGWSAYIDELGERTGGFHASPLEGKVWKTLLCHNFLGNASCTMIRRTCLEHVGLYDSTYHLEGVQGCEDWDLYLRLARCFEFRVLPEILIEYRKTAASMSNANPKKMAASHRRLWQNLHSEAGHFPWFMERFSTGSFYQYLGNEALHRSSFAESRYWLRQAVRYGQLCTLLRPDYYVQFARAWLGRPPCRRPQHATDDAALTERIRADNSLRLQTWLHRVITFLARDFS